MKKYNIITYGCQMNENDSEKISKMLSDLGYTHTDNINDAQILIMNTCSVRENADDRFFGNLGYMKNIKRQNNMIIAVCGCMVQQEHILTQIKEKYPFVDIIFGTHNIYEFPALLEQHLKSNKAVYKVKDSTEEIVEGVESERKYKYKAYVKIMQGCNNFCSYCVVPFTRGREKSRKKEDIINEIKYLAHLGVKEIMLLGQNVNSYGIADNFETTFPELLREINKIESIKRIRFMTSHPKDLSNELIEAMADCENVCSHLHLPLQSGSSRILNLMNRKYDKEKYLSLIDKIKSRIPDISLTTDIIVGFPTESEEDFCETLDVIKKVRFDGAYTFIYSARKGTKAYEMKHDVPDAQIIKERFSRLLDLQQKTGEENNRKFLNKTMEVLAEGRSKTDREILTGRTFDNRLVNYKGTSVPGEFVNVKITQTKSFYLQGVEIN